MALSPLFLAHFGASCFENSRLLLKKLITAFISFSIYESVYFQKCSVLYDLVLEFLLLIWRKIFTEYSLGVHTYIKVGPELYICNNLVIFSPFQESGCEIVQDGHR